MPWAAVHSCVAEVPMLQEPKHWCVNARFTLALTKHRPSSHRYGSVIALLLSWGLDWLNCRMALSVSSLADLVTVQDLLPGYLDTLPASGWRHRAMNPCCLGIASGMPAVVRLIFIHFPNRHMTNHIVRPKKMKQVSIVKKFNQVWPVHERISMELEGSFPHHKATWLPGQLTT